MCGTLSAKFKKRARTFDSRQWSFLAAIAIARVKSARFMVRRLVSTGNDVEILEISIKIATTNTEQRVYSDHIS